MFGRRKISLELQPVFDLIDTGPGDGGRCFDSFGDDPQFGPADADVLTRIRPGWWRVRWRLIALDGWIVTPKIYVDYGMGYTEADSVTLREPDDAGISDTIIRIRDSVRAIRVDPTARTAKFVAGPMVLTRLSRPVAAYMLIQGIRHAEFGSEEQSKIAQRRLLSNLFGSQRTQAAHKLWMTYMEAGERLRTSYDLWYRLYTPMVAELRGRADALKGAGASVDILLHASGAKSDGLGLAMDSVEAQLWGSWTLWIALPQDADAGVRSLLESRARGDSRIQLLPCEGDCWPAAINDALHGPLVMMLEHDAVLAVHATCEFAHALSAMPEAEVFYCDSDTRDNATRRSLPQFKPAWNALLFESHHYIGPSWAVKSECLRRVGLGGRMADPRDLLGRCVTGLDERRVMHIPKVLYHRAPQAADPAPISSRAGTPLVKGPKVSVVIPTRDRLDLLRVCVEGVRTGTRYENVDIVIVDNGSEESETLAYLDELGLQPGCRVVRDASPFNFSALINLGVLSCDGEYVCLLNNDIEVISPDWLGELMAIGCRGDIGAVGALLYYPDGTIQHGGVLLGVGGVAGHAHHGAPRGTAGYMHRASVPQEMSAVTGACMLVRRKAFEEVGGFDEGYPVAFNDIDFCLRLRQAGWRIGFTPWAELVHHESVSRGKEDTHQKQSRFDSEVARMRNRWGEVLLDDPAYNPNLTLDWADFRPSFPPRVETLRTHVVPQWWRSRELRSRDG